MSAPRLTVRVQEADFDLGAEAAALTEGRADVGAVATFTGLVRDMGGAGGGGAGGGGGAMTLEHYPGMTERALADFAALAAARWRGAGATVIHRHGRLAPGDRIVMVATASAHRAAAFEAAEFLMDYLKTRAPFWKREEGPEGARWVEARETDEAAARRWG
jgi:molybdopterin synthase catalytic subunit